jgi:ABC-type branched-subunit amino acid transport system permease subunit
MFFTDTLVGIWRLRNRSTLSVEETDLNELLGDRLLQTIALWSLRNREKARWLRRAWLFLALGVLLISVAGLLVVAATLKDYSDLDIFGIVAVGLILVWTVLRVDWFFTDRGGVQHAEDQELERIASKLLGDDRRRPFADRDGRHRPRATSG